jgi:hypothetical protein
LKIEIEKIKAHFHIHFPRILWFYGRPRVVNHKVKKLTVPPKTKVQLMPIDALSDILTFSTTTVVASPSIPIKISIVGTRETRRRKRGMPSVCCGMGMQIKRIMPNNSKMIPNERIVRVVVVVASELVASNCNS